MTPTQTPTNGRPRPAKQPRTLEEHLEWVEELSADGADLVPLAHGLLRGKFQLEAALDEVRNVHTDLREQILALTAPQQYPAVITDTGTRGAGTVEVYGAGHLMRAVQSQCRWVADVVGGEAV